MEDRTANDRIESLRALFARAGEAHHVFETTELKGVYDQDWPSWYAAYAVGNGIGALIGREITADELAKYLASSNAAFEAIEPQPTEPWATYTARRVAAEL